MRAVPCNKIRKMRAMTPMCARARAARLRCIIVDVCTHGMAL